jgi:hypothetical protein
MSQMALRKLKKSVIKKWYKWLQEKGKNRDINKNDLNGGRKRGKIVILLKLTQMALGNPEKSMMLKIAQMAVVKAEKAVLFLKMTKWR